MLVNGQLAAFVRRRNPLIQVFLPDNEPEKSQYAKALAKKLAELAVRRQTRRQGLFIEKINDMPAREHFIARFLEDAGFVSTVLGFQMRRVSPAALPDTTPPDVEEDADDEGASETA